MSAPQPPSRGLNWRGILGIVISIVLLYFAFRGVEDLGEVWGAIAAADPLYLLVATFFATAVFVIRAWRWEPILRPMGDTGFRSRFAATTVGFMTNNLLPARVGEFARAYAMSRLEPVTISASLGSLVVERLFDGLTLVALLAFTMAMPVFPEVGTVGGRDLGDLAGTMFLAFGGLAVILAAVVLWPGPAVGFAERMAERLLPSAVRRPVVDALKAFLEGVGVLRRPVLLLQISLWSLGLWLFNSLGFWFAFQAFDIDVPFVGALFVQSVVALMVAIPSAPGMFGVYEAAARIGLVTVWGVEVAPALAFAIGFHLAGYIPVTLIGLYYVWRLGLSWREVEQSEEAVETAVERSAAGGTGDVSARGGESHGGKGRAAGSEK